jgi:hypothetical protein
MAFGPFVSQLAERKGSGKIGSEKGLIGVEYKLKKGADCNFWPVSWFEQAYRQRDD